MNITKVEFIKRNEPERREYYSHSRVYIWPKGETILENLVERRTRPYNKWRPLVLQALQENGVSVRKLTWSQKAGCVCGCSPGFIVHTNSYGPVRSDHVPSDVHIDMCM